MTTTADLRAQLHGTVRMLDPDTMTGEQAARVVQDLAAIEKLAATGRMFAALRVARTDAWRGGGHASAAEWLAAQAGISVREAASQIGTAKKADRLPKTKDAMRDGELSPDQAGAVADAATADPAAEDDLLDTARHDTNRNLKDKAAKTKAAATDAATRERRIRAQRSMRRGTDAEGAFFLRIWGPGVDAAGFEAMIRPFEELIFRDGRRSGQRDTFENRSYDAFFAMLAHLAAGHPGSVSAPADPTEPSVPTDPTVAADPHAGTRASHGPGAPGRPAPATPDPAGPDPAGSAQPPRPNAGPPSPPAPPPPWPPDERMPRPGPDPGPDPDRRPDPHPAPHHDVPSRTSGAPPSGPPAWSPPWDPDRSVPLPAKLPGGNNVKVIVLVSHEALLRGSTQAGDTCEIAGVGPVSVTAVREILRSDPFLAVVVKRGRDVVSVAHHGRGLNAHQRTAIEALGLQCTNVACNRTIALQIDHRVPWVEHQETKLDNADPLCDRCHRLKTHHGWSLEAGTGRRRFRSPDEAAREGPEPPGTGHTADAGPPTARPAPTPTPSARATSSPAPARTPHLEQPALL